MEHYSNFNLKKHHTFATNTTADNFYICTHENQLSDFFKTQINESDIPLILGQGSNMLFSKPYRGSIIHIKNKGISVLNQTKEQAVIQAAAGEIWDVFVQYCINHNLYGTENLSYIPGTVGAAPVQNIGAYGAEVKDIIHRVYAFDIKTQKQISFSNNQCEFDYRNSIFKHKFKKRYIITKVDFVLKKKGRLNTQYGSIAQEAQKYPELNLQSLREIIINIRKSKLPEPDELPNAGSFFKNPIISKEHFEELKRHHTELVSYPMPANKVKAAAGQLIDIAGFKGYRYKGAAVHEKQALVLVNHQNAKGSDIWELAQIIQAKIKQQFNITLEPEVNIM